MTKVALVHSVSPEIYDEIALYSPEGLTTISIDLKKSLDTNNALVKDAEFLLYVESVMVMANIVFGSPNSAKYRTV